MDYSITPTTKPEQPASFTAIVAVYGVPLENNTILTRSAAVSLRDSINEHPERASVTRDNVLYAVKEAWLEDEDGFGRVMIEYERADK